MIHLHPTFFLHMKEIDEILTTITEVYQRDVFTVQELCAILSSCGYTSQDVRRIVLQAMRCKLMGRVSFKTLRRMPSRNSLVALSKIPFSY